MTHRRTFIQLLGMAPVLPIGVTLDGCSAGLLEETKAIYAEAGSWYDLQYEWLCQAVNMDTVLDYKIITGYLETLQKALGHYATVRDISLSEAKEELHPLRRAAKEENRQAAYAYFESSVD